MLRYWLHPILISGLIRPTRSLTEKRKALRGGTSAQALETCKAFSEAWASQPLADSPGEPGLGCVDRAGEMGSRVPHIQTSHGEGLSQWNSSANTSAGN